MAKTADYVVQYRRKRENRTDYKSRLRLLKSETTRLVLRPTNKHMLAQLVDYRKEGDVVVAAASSKELTKLGWRYATSNTPAAYLTGLLCGIRGQKKGIKNAVPDIGLRRSIKGSRIYAALKGAIDSGLKIPADENIFPDENRLMGEHIASYHKGRESITEEFNKIKEKINETLRK